MPLTDKQLADRRAWEQTRAELGPVPSADEGSDEWFARRDEQFNELLIELKAWRRYPPEENTTCL